MEGIEIILVVFGIIIGRIGVGVGNQGIAQMNEILTLAGLLTGITGSLMFLIGVISIAGKSL